MPRVFVNFRLDLHTAARYRVLYTLVDMNTLYPLLALALSLPALGQCPESPVSLSADGAQAAVQPLPLIVAPPQSSGTDQGFSRSPSPGRYDEGKGILVKEFITRTAYRSPKGNNSRFVIMEYSVDPTGKELRRTTREVFEGTSRWANEDTVVFERMAPYTFREELGDGAYALYKLVFDAQGKLQRMEQSFFGKDGAVLSQQIIYSRDAA